MEYSIVRNGKISEHLNSCVSTVKWFECARSRFAVYFSIQIYSCRLAVSFYFLSRCYSICHCQWNRKCRSLWHSDYNTTKYKCDFMPMGEKCLKIIMVCELISRFPTKSKILWRTTWAKFYSSHFFFSLYRSLAAFVHPFARSLSLARSLVRFAFISGVYCVLANWMHRLSCKNTLNSESTNVKELKLNCTLVFHSILLLLVLFFFVFSLYPFSGTPLRSLCLRKTFPL